MHITPDQHSVVCRQLFPRPSGAEMAAIYDGYLAAMESKRYADLVIEFDITTLDRVVPALATWAHETGGFRVMFESGTYTTITQLLKIFGAPHHSAGITEAEAPKYIRNPVVLFERAYGLGNPVMAAKLGNHSKGDGWRFRGTGIGQITGRRDHERYTAEIGCPLDGLKEPINSIHAALLEWRNKDCNAAADAGDLRRVRRLINGGYNGWEDFESKCALLRKAFLALEPADLDSPGARFLSLGDRGPAVMQLQEDLRARGFYETGQLDDIFGAMTRRALVAFQVAQGLPATGIYDEPTQAAMAAAPPEATLPGRKAVEPPTSRINVVLRLVERVKSFWKWLLGLFGLNELLTQSGFVPIDKLLSGVEKTQGLLTKLSIQPRFILYGIGAVIAISFIVWASSAAEAQADAKKTGQSS